MKWRMKWREWKDNWMYWSRLMCHQMTYTHHRESDAKTNTICECHLIIVIWLSFLCFHDQNAQIHWECLNDMLHDNSFQIVLKCDVHLRCYRYNRYFYIY